jgi:hypothetical protein
LLCHCDEWTRGVRTLTETFCVRFITPRRAVLLLDKPPMDSPLSLFRGLHRVLDPRTSTTSAAQLRRTRPRTAPFLPSSTATRRTAHCPSSSRPDTASSLHGSPPRRLSPSPPRCFAPSPLRPLVASLPHSLASLARSVARSGKTAIRTLLGPAYQKLKKVPTLKDEDEAKALMAKMLPQ